jgi:ribosomal-protein-alanine N-acetyltransferase
VAANRRPPDSRDLLPSHDDHLYRVAIMRMFDLVATKRFYLDYLAARWIGRTVTKIARRTCRSLRAGLVLHLPSSRRRHAGGAVLVEIEGVEALHGELHCKDYPFLNPRLEPGPGGGQRCS